MPATARDARALRAINQSQVEYEVLDDDGIRLRFHLGCHVVWKFEPQARAATQRSYSVRFPYDIPFDFGRDQKGG
jgi:hypothetical protein